MAEQIMWAVRDREGQLLLRIIAQDAYWAKRNFVGAEMHRWVDAEVKGYRYIRVRVTEVQDGA